MRVGDMEWKDMYDIVERQLNKLAMCKRGTVATDINRMKDALGNRPYLSNAERKEVKKGLAAKIQAACKITRKQAEKMDTREIQHHIASKIDKIYKGAYVHPGEKAYDRDLERINQQEKERIAQLDGDFQDVKDNFHLGLVDIKEFPRIRMELEAREW